VISRVKGMKSLKFAFAASVLLTLAVPAAAQMGSTDSKDFMDAVHKHDGNTVMNLLATHPTIINTRDPDGDTALIVALRAADPDWTSFLLGKGADPNLPAGNSDTPLIAATRAGFDEGVSTLIAVGAKVNETNRSGETPLIVAVQQRDTKLVKLLLEQGADPDRSDAVAGYSARDYAKRDARARDILNLIESVKKPKAAASAAN
jgi:uncharacterized protein